MNTQIRILFLSVALLLINWSCTKSEEPDSKKPDETKKEITIKVMTYNLWGAKGRTMAELRAMAEVIKRADPDLVALQEVDKFTTRNKTDDGKPIDMAKELGEMTGMDYFFAKAENFYGGEYGDAVLSKLPIKEKKGFNLEVDPSLGGERRSVARIKVEKDGKQFYFVSTHFDHLRDERNRIKQSKDFIEMAKKFDLPVIGGGDLNAHQASQTMRIFAEYFTLGCINGNCTQGTYPTPVPVGTIDYLFFAPLSAFSTKQYSVYTWADKESDHFPVLATFKINIK